MFSMIVVLFFCFGLGLLFLERDLDVLFIGSYLLLSLVAFIFYGVFKGLGKMQYLRNVLLFSTLLVFIPVIFTTDQLELKLYGIFTAFTLWIIARGLPLIIKFRKTFKPLAQKT